MENNTSSTPSLLKEIGRVALVALVVLAVLAGPAWLAASSRGLTGLSLATLLCLVPGCIAVTAKVLLRLSAVTFFLLASGLRLTFVMGGALVATSVVEGVAFLELPLWLLLNYMVVLLTESLATLKYSGQAVSATQKNDMRMERH